MQGGGSYGDRLPHFARTPAPPSQTGPRSIYESLGNRCELGVTGAAMAIFDHQSDWKDRFSPGLAEIEQIAREAYAHLPREFRKLTGDVQIRIAEFPTEDVADDLGLETPFDLLGLFEGRGIAELWNPATGDQVNRITLYRRAILDYWAENDETLGDIVTHVLIHELGHHFGLSDDDMARIEASAG